ncbi:hypothetical protein CDV36_006675 [Fusarium kuroshium]|uniref:Uncharacterized protein n=1 Tax=Fusarium kuroshium TaxID=2010991 RepID=A0A3M2S7Y0_9HYPO|nr:hypothetical protein CDV36_006675 [Fusarium kuroshium]
MPEGRPPTPATGDDSLALGPTRKTIDAEFCTAVRFHVETYPTGPLLAHNFWFHESWSGFEAPMNILLMEVHRKPLVFILPHAPEGTPKNDYSCGIMKFHGTRPQRSERGPANPGSQGTRPQGNRPQGNGRYADADRPSFFRASTNRARGMANSIRLPTFRLPPARWWLHKVMLLLKTLWILVVTTLVIYLGFKLASHAPEMREIIVAKFASVTQASGHAGWFNTGADHLNSFFDTGKDQFTFGDTHSPKTDRGRPKSAKDYPKSSKDYPKASKDYPKAAKDYPKASKEYPKAAKDYPKAAKDYPKASKDHPKPEKDNIKTDKGHPRSERDNTKKGNGAFKFDRNADGNHIHGSWTEPDDTHITFEASKTSGGDVTEVKFVQSEEQFIKDENDTVLFSLNRITRFLVTLIGGDNHDEKLDKIMNGIASMPSPKNKKVRSRWWW